jgi:hypothetical protein
MSETTVELYEMTGGSWALRVNGRVYAAAWALAAGGCLVEMGGTVRPTPGDAREALLGVAYAQAVRDIDAATTIALRLSEMMHKNSPDRPTTDPSGEHEDAP